MEIKDINWKKVRLLILIPVLIIATVIYMLSGCRAEEPAGSEVYAVDTESVTKPGEEFNNNNTKESDVASGNIYVDVGGAVVTPKVVCLTEGARIFEAIDAAGGISKTAVTKYLNMAAVCEDGQKIYVPSLSEITDDEKNSAITSSAGYTGGLERGDSGLGTGGKVNINTASSEQLQTLSGIGPSMAARIIQYREENGKFATIDDLTNVSGIGEKTLAKFADRISV